MDSANLTYEQLQAERRFFHRLLNAGEPDVIRAILDDSVELLDYEWSALEEFRADAPDHVRPLLDRAIAEFYGDEPEPAAPSSVPTTAAEMIAMAAAPAEPEPAVSTDASEPQSAATISEPETSTEVPSTVEDMFRLSAEPQGPAHEFTVSPPRPDTGVPPAAPAPAPQTAEDMIRLASSPASAMESAADEPQSASDAWDALTVGQIREEMVFVSDLIESDDVSVACATLTRDPVYADLEPWTRDRKLIELLERAPAHLRPFLAGQLAHRTAPSVGHVLSGVASHFDVLSVDQMREERDYILALHEDSTHGLVLLEALVGRDADLVYEEFHNWDTERLEAYASEAPEHVRESMFASAIEDHREYWDEDADEDADEDEIEYEEGAPQTVEEMMEMAREATAENSSPFSNSPLTAPTTAEEMFAISRQTVASPQAAESDLSAQTSEPSADQSQTSDVPHSLADMFRAARAASERPDAPEVSSAPVPLDEFTVGRPDDE
jgi:hypothetical protein